MRPVHPAPSRDPIAIGAKLRATRTAQGLTIAEVAEASGVTKSFLSRIERDETSPSVATLRSLCDVLSLPIGALFAPPEHQILGLDEAPAINMGGTGVLDRLVSPRSEARVQILRSTLQPGASGGEDLYTVNCDVEIVHVLAGALRVTLGQQTYDLVAGDTMSLPGREPHTWHNVYSNTTEIMWTLVPAAWSGSASAN